MLNFVVASACKIMYRNLVSQSTCQHKRMLKLTTPTDVQSICSSRHSCWRVYSICDVNWSHIQIFVLPFFLTTSVTDVAVWWGLNDECGLFCVVNRIRKNKLIRWKTTCSCAVLKLTCWVICLYRASRPSPRYNEPRLLISFHFTSHHLSFCINVQYICFLLKKYCNLMAA